MTAFKRLSGFRLNQLLASKKLVTVVCTPKIHQKYTKNTPNLNKLSR